MFLRWRSVSCTLSATERSLGRETAQSECTFNTDHDFIFLNITLQWFRKLFCTVSDILYKKLLIKNVKSTVSVVCTRNVNTIKIYLFFLAHISNPLNLLLPSSLSSFQWEETLRLCSPLAFPFPLFQFNCTKRTVIVQLDLKT